MAVATSLQDLAAAANLRWYAGLVKPPLAPPAWLAAAASVVLAAVTASGFFRVLCRPDYLPDRPTAIRAFLIGLALDVLWAWLFFAGRHPTAALAASIALAAAAASAAWRFAVVDRGAGLLLAPWVAATSYVFLLDLTIALHNG